MAAQRIQWGPLALFAALGWVFINVVNEDVGLMATGLSAPPPEPPRIDDESQLAPAFYAKVQRVKARLQAQGWSPVSFETIRTDERQQWLYGFGRTWDDPTDPRGIVTNAPDASTSWHPFGLADDIIDANSGWSDQRFFLDLRDAAVAEGLVSGGNWHTKDWPHVQWNVSGQPGVASTDARPSAHAQQLRASGQLAAVWQQLNAA